MHLSGLTPPERALRDGFARGDWVDLRTGDPARDDFTQGAGWGPARTVRAEVIAALLLGAEKLQSGAVAAVRLAGARITQSPRAGQRRHWCSIRAERLPAGGTARSGRSPNSDYQPDPLSHTGLQRPMDGDRWPSHVPQLHRQR